MSGQQIGAAVGFVVGAFFGAPQLGAAIGGMIGGWISPTQINGPHIGDSADQSSQEGQPIPWIIGTCGWVQGNIVDKSKVREVKKTDDGKGSGQEVNTFEAHQDFQIMVCESSETRESLMVGVLIVKVDGKIVYDMRPASNFGADNAKFLKNHTFYDGNEAQLPDPTMEALPHNGVGNTPYYRGVFTMVARDINLSQYGSRIPVYEFVMVGSGENVTEDTEELTVSGYGRFINASWPLADPESLYRYKLSWVDSGGGYTSPVFDSIAECQEWFLDNLGLPAPTSYIGYSANTIGNAGQFNTGEDGSGNRVTFNGVEDQVDVTNITSLVLLYQFEIPERYLNIAPDGACGLVGTDWTGVWNGSVMKQTADIGDLLVFSNCGDGTFTAGYYPVCIQVFPKRPPASEAPLGDPCLLGVPVKLPGSPGFTIDCAGNVQPEPTVTPMVGSFRVLQIEAYETIDNVQFFTRRVSGPVTETAVSPDPAFWEPAYEASVAAGRSPPGWTFGVEYPVVTSDGIYLLTYSITSLEEEPLGLDTLLTRISVRGGLSAEDIDVSEMDQDVLGYMITQSYTGADSIRPLMTAFKSYGSEYDAQIHFHKHGEDAELIIDPQDIIQGSDKSDEDTRDQAVVFPKTYSITYIDPTQDYAARPQVDRRISSDVRAIGEIQTQVAVVLQPDYARQLANVGMKVNWARAVGSREFSTPFAQFDVYLEAVAGKPFFIEGQRRIASEMSLQDGEIQFKGLYDRQSAYTSDIQATPALPPTPPPSNIGGITQLAVMNLPVLRDQDDVVGLYFAVSGLLNGWPGCLLQVSADDQVSWQTAISSMTEASTMGYLTAELPLAPAAGDDVTNTLSVSVNGELNTITRQQYLNEGNPCAIIKPLDTAECEVLGFQYADEISSGVYGLTTLVRGGLSTAPAAHAQGARFVALSSVYFWQVPSAWIGRTLWFRAVTFGTAPEESAAYAVLFQPAVSQTEWTPVYLTGRYGLGSSFQLSVTPRHRLGNDVTPIASVNFTGFRWTATDGTVTQTQDTIDPVATFDLSDFGSPVTFSVSLLNRITGPGPSVSITL